MARGIYGADFDSSRRFYENATKVVQMTPTAVHARATFAVTMTPDAEIAKLISMPKAVRAVASLAADKPAVAVPSHHIMGIDGSLTGYRWSIDPKRQLIARKAKS